MLVTTAVAHPLPLLLTESERIRAEIHEGFDAWAACKQSPFHYIVRYMQLILGISDQDTQKQELQYLLESLRCGNVTVSASPAPPSAPFHLSTTGKSPARGEEQQGSHAEDNIDGFRGHYRLAEQNAHPLDSRIQFDEPSHTYYVDGLRVGISVSGILKKYVPGMDAPRVIDTYFKRWQTNVQDKYYLLIKYFEINLGIEDQEVQKREIARVWAASGKDAADRGTYMHAQIEKCLNGVAYDAEGAEMQQFQRWRATFLPDLDLEPYRTEWSVFYKEADLAGQIDSLFRSRVDPDIYVMVDWKRCNPEPYQKGAPPDVLDPAMDVFRNQRCRGICSSLPAHDYSKYCLQQNLYRFMVEESYGIRISRCFLVQFHPYLMHPSLGGAFDAGHTIEVQPLDALVRKIIEERVCEVHGIPVPPPREEDTTAERRSTTKRVRAAVIADKDDDDARKRSAWAMQQIHIVDDEDTDALASIM